MLVECVAFRGDPRGVRLAMLVLKLRGTGLQESAEVIPVFLGWLLPVRPDRIPAIAQTLFIGIAILRVQCGHALRTGDRKTKAYRRAVVKDVKCITGQAQSVREALDDFRQVLECVAKALCRWSVREAKTRQVRSNHMVLIGEPVHKAAILMTGTGEPVEQENRGRVLRPRLTIEEVEV